MRIELLKLFTDRRLWTGPAVGVVLILIAVNAAVIRYTDVIHAPPGARREEQGMFLAELDKARRPVRFDWSLGDHLDKYEPYIPDARKTRLVILSGMSQMYTINEYKHGDQIISEWMDDALAPRGVRVFGIAAPNLSHEEALFLLLTTMSHPQTKPYQFVFAVAFEKLREVDLRPQYQAYLTAHPELLATWREVALRHRREYPLATRKMLATLDQIESAAKGEKATFETKLRSKVAGVVPVVRERKNLNSHVRSAIYNVRNAIFGINNMTKRPIVPERYDTNREFLGLLADVAHENGVGVIFYIVPFNPRAENPYVPEEYAAFKGWLAELARQKQIPLANLENVVPADDWGKFFGGPDFKHFKGEGHRKTAAALVSAFGDQLAAPRRENVQGGAR